jgi:hypothetical protein
MLPPLFGSAGVRSEDSGMPYAAQHEQVINVERQKAQQRLDFLKSKLSAIESGRVSPRVLGQVSPRVLGQGLPQPEQQASFNPARSGSFKRPMERSSSFSN